jgi:hypothetical protein
MTGRTEEPLHQVVARAVGAGSSPALIARQLGISRQRASLAVQRAVAVGLIDDPRFHTGDRLTLFRATQFPIGGGVRDMVLDLGDDAARWLLDQVPPGGRLIDVIRSILLDAFLDAVDADADQPRQK